MMGGRGPSPPHHHHASLTASAAVATLMQCLLASGVLLSAAGWGPAVCGPGRAPVRAPRSWALADGGQQAHLGAVEVSAGRSAKVVWSRLPVLPSVATITVCAPLGDTCGPAHERDRLAAVDQAAADDSSVAAVTAVVTALADREACPLTVHVQASNDQLDALRTASTVAGGCTSSVAGCSDGLDSDGDGLVDAADPGCRSGGEHLDNRAPSSLSWSWGTAPTGDFLKELRWTNTATGTTVQVVSDEPSAAVPNGCRWWPHGGNCSHWVQSYSNNSAREPQDWAWSINVPDGHGGGPQYQEKEGAIKKRLLSSSRTSAVFESASARLRLVDTFTLRGDTMYMSINATSLMPSTVRATFLTQFGSLQLHGQKWHLGNKRLGSLDRNWSYVEACTYPYDGAAPMPSRACFSAASAMGDADHFSVGFQCLTPIGPDSTDALLAYMDVPANPRTPTSSTTLTLALRPGETRTFVLAMKITPPAGEGLARPAVLKSMEAAVEPYVHMFHAVWGQTPEYCPTPAVSYEDAINYGLNRHPVCSARYPTGNPISGMQNCNPWGNDTECDCWWRNGTRMYDVLNVETLLQNSVAREFATPYHVSWRPGVQSSHLTIPSRREQCEFDPNAVSAHYARARFDDSTASLTRQRLLLAGSFGSTPGCILG